MSKKKARVLAFYLPQFHPTLENNNWWGKGFTEWTNVAKAKPLFKGHDQPVIPADLGFYDLRLPETRLAQAKMAFESGIEGFCYWHYWFNGKRMLERPFDEVLKSKSPDFPFCLAWANHSWTGIWKDEPDRFLINQTYPGEEDDLAHFNCLLKAFRDKRYILVDGKPLFVIFKPNDIPNLQNKLNYWRNLAKKAKLKGIYVIGINMNDFSSGKKLGLDGIILSRLGKVNYNTKLLNEVTRLWWGIIRRLSLGGPRVISYKDAIKFLIPNKVDFDVPVFPCAFPNWDNTPRKGRKGFVLKNSNPELFSEHFTDAMNMVKEHNDEEKLIFIKSWNEWAEGNYLEPDLKWGHGYLDVIKGKVCD